MSTSPISSGTPGTQVPSTVSNKYDLKTQDFIKMMITQLQNQDPMEPAKNQELLAQMSQIGQLQTSNQLQDMLKGLATQNQIGAAGNLIGKVVGGHDADDNVITGIVSSVRVTKDGVSLELHNGKTLALEDVTDIAGAANAATVQ